jgi:hypothetical protein
MQVQHGRWEGILMFAPEGGKRVKRECMALHLPENLSDELNAAVKKTGIKKTHLVRQMIAYCLNEMKKGKKKGVGPDTPRS